MEKLRIKYVEPEKIRYEELGKITQDIIEKLGDNPELLAREFGKELTSNTKKP